MASDPSENCPKQWVSLQGFLDSKVIQSPGVGLSLVSTSGARNWVISPPLVCDTLSCGLGMASFYYVITY